MRYFLTKKSSIELFIRERISTSILTSATSVNHSIAGVLNKHPMDVLAFSCDCCRKLSDIAIGWLLSRCPGGYFQIRRSGGGGGGLGPHIKFGGKIWGKVRPSSPNKRKNLGSSVSTRRKSWEKVPILGSYPKFRQQNLGYLSLIFLEAKFGAPTRISEADFGAKPPDLLI